jgi:hypothetical protein
VVTHDQSLCGRVRATRRVERGPPHRWLVRAAAVPGRSHLNASHATHPRETYRLRERCQFVRSDHKGHSGGAQPTRQRNTTAQRPREWATTSPCVST